VVVADTSALIGAWHAHYPPASIRGFWAFLDEAMHDGRVIVPSLVFDEIVEQSDGLSRWLRDRHQLVVPPGEDVQRFAGYLQATYRFAVGRDKADPFVIAEAHVRVFVVATYEGRSPTGKTAKSKKDVDSMPTICKAEKIACYQPAEAWARAGLVM